MKKKIKLMLDINQYPLWRIDNDNYYIGKGVIKISNKLETKIQFWIDLNMLGFDWEYPPDSIIYPGQKKLLKIIGKEIWKELIKEIGDEYDVLYFEDNKLLSPEEIK